MENGEKNREVGYGKPPEGKPFTSENQPSPEAKSKGVKEYWNRKKEAQELMDGGKKYLDMKYNEFVLLDKATVEYFTQKRPVKLQVDGMDIEILLHLIKYSNENTILR